MGEILISFVIPVLNDKNNIARCLRSIRNLRVGGSSYEVVIIDNGSNDGTHQIISDLGFQFHVMPGVPVSMLRNQGATLSKGTLLAFVDSDVELSPQWAEKGIGEFDDPSIVAAGCFPGVPQEATWVQRGWDLHQRGRKQLAHPFPVSWLPSMNLIVRRDVFFKVGGFNEDLITAEDVDLCYRLSEHGVIVCDPAMEAVHWGEAPDLSIFWRKEVWRGMGNLPGVFLHKFRWEELPSIGFPLYIIGVVLFLLIGTFRDIWSGEILFVGVGISLLVIPAFLIALNTVFLSRRPSFIPQMFLLYLTYGFARAFAILKSLAKEMRYKSILFSR